MFTVLALLSQVALALACLCEEYSEYYSSCTSTQPTGYEYASYPYASYDPYSSGYSYNYGAYAQPASYDTTTINTIVYPYPAPIIYESPKEEPSCECRIKKEKIYRYDEEEYCSARCTCISAERERYPEYRDSKPKCGCRHSEDYYRRDSDRYDGGDYENDRGCKVKCICICDETRGDFRDLEDRRDRYDDRGYRRETNRDCGCKRKQKHSEYY